MRGSTGRLGRHWNLAVDQFAVAGAHGNVRLDKTVMTVERGLTGWTSIEAALPAFDAAPMVGIVRDAAADVHGVETWLGGLDPRGRIEGAKIRYDFDDHALDYEARRIGHRARELERRAVCAQRQRQSRRHRTQRRNRC